jgi:hypothetical protein
MKLPKKYIEQTEFEGVLDLSSVTEIPEGWNPTVGGDLYLSSVTEIPEGWNPTVGGYLYLSSGSKYIGASVPGVRIPGVEFLQWENGKFALMDGIFGEVIKHKGNLWKMRKINGTEFYVVGDGNGNFSHGETAEDAAQDLIFKVTNKTTDDYKDMTRETVLEFKDAVCAYRVITGACSFGVKDFVNTVLDGKPEKEYSIGMVIELTSGHYGADKFASFFGVSNQ